MSKAELVQVIADHHDLPKATVSKILDTLIEYITSTLKKGEPVPVKGLGSFSVSHRAARKGRNPQTGSEIQIAASRVVKFKPGKKLKEEISGK